VLPVTRPWLPGLDEYVDLLKDIWQSRMLSNFGKYAQLLEAKSRTYLGNPQALAVVNADIGLVLSLAALRLPEGSECLVPSFTFNSTINAVLWNRLRPVFVDADPGTFNADPQDVARRIGPRTSVLVATHVFGSPLDLDRLLSVAASRGLPTVFDAAHAFGAKYFGRKIGDPSLGDFQVFSFSGTKLVTSGEGGLICPGKAEHVEHVERLRGYGFLNDYVSHHVGLNGKLSELHAALATLTVDRAEDAVTHRHGLAALYRRLLAACDGIGFQRHLPEARTTYKDFAILCPWDRDGLGDRLGRLGVQTKKYFHPLHTMPAYEAFRRPDDDLADTESVSERILCLPMFNDLEEGEVERVCRAILEFYGVRDSG
jgi:dTDP-4-amino-4,6-dideoxygalactose transaminase